MYNDLKKKCETFKEEILKVLPELTEGGCIKDVRSGKLLQFINSAAREADHIIKTIEAYYSEE